MSHHILLRPDITVHFALFSMFVPRSDSDDDDSAD
ncbi:MAG: hypothetical protein JWN98_107, partial [Abditibacteriota bacterium]|nr:hypothetical protein [Abditibacteriota bacterium]